MKNAMDYETMDWEAEARRVAWAFGVSEECRFKESPIIGLPLAGVTRLPAQSRVLVLRREGIFLEAVYTDYAKSFSVEKDGFEGNSGAAILVGYDGRIIKLYAVDGCGSELARLLFKLNLLAPELEANLGVSAHDKLAWAIEI